MHTSTTRSGADSDRIRDTRAIFDIRAGNPIAPDVAVAETTLGGVPTVVLTPSSPGPGAVLFLHGGAYLAGSARSHTPLAAALAARAGQTTYVIDYRLTPENPISAAHDDALAAYRALAAEHGHGEIGLVGDSAGAGLVLATLQRARDAGVSLPGAIVTFSGLFDLTLSGTSLTTKEAVDPVFDAADIAWFRTIALAGDDPADPLVSPILADLHGLPPMLLQVGSYEVLLDDTMTLATRAAAADVEVVAEVYPGAAHVFQHDAAGEADPTAVRAVDSAARFLTARLAG